MSILEGDIPGKRKFLGSESCWVEEEEEPARNLRTAGGSKIVRREEEGDASGEFLLLLSDPTTSSYFIEESSEDDSLVPDDVLELCLRHLDVSQLKACRLVCKFWNQEACRLLRNKVVLRLNAELLPEFLDNKGVTMSLNLPTAVGEIELDIMDDDAFRFKEAIVLYPELSPAVTKVSISHYSNSLRESALANIAWTVGKCANYVTYLYLFSSNSHMDFVIGCLRRNFTFPQLHKLQVLVHPTSTDSDEEHLNKEYAVMDIISRVAQHSPKLRNLIIRGGNHLAQVDAIRGNPFDIAQLEHLTIPAKSFMFYEMLRQDSPLPRLKSFILTCQRLYMPEQGGDICDILHRFAPTLEHLELTGILGLDTNIKFNKWARRMPFFPRLKYFYVASSFDVRERWLIKMPRLRHLRVRKIYLHHIFDDEEDPHPVFSTLEKISAWILKFPPNESQRTRALTSLHRLFPNVRLWDTQCDCMHLLKFAYDNPDFKIREVSCRVDSPLFRVEYFEGIKRLKVICPSSGINLDIRHKMNCLRDSDRLPELERISVEQFLLWKS